MLTTLPDTLLAIALLLIVVSAVQPLARKLMLSSTVVLAVVGVLLGGGATVLFNAPHLTALDEAAGTLLRFPVNAEAFLFIFLPLLVFHGSLSIDVRRLARDWAPVLVMAVVAVVATTAAIGYALHPLSGVPLTACLMLGAIVATTDPSAVVAIFHDIGADSRLTRLVEGESLLNDAAAISIFTIFLGQLTGQHGLAPLEVVLSFLTSFAGGIAVGFLMARAMLFAVPLMGGSRTAEVTLTLALPYVAFIVCDHILHVSGVVSAAAAGLTVSAVGPSTFRPRSWQFLQDIWDQLSFWGSSMVFVLASMLVPRLLLGMEQHDLLLIGVVILAAMAARAAVLFGVMPLLRYAHLSQRVPIPFKVTMLWGGLRGAITLALALSVTENAAVPQRIQQFVAIVATGYVLSTLLVNGTTLRFLVHALKLDRLSATDQALRNQVVAIGLGEVRDKLRRTAAELGFSAPATAHVGEMYDRRVKVETAANTFDTAIGDRDRVVLGLITFASQERSMLLEMFQDQGLSRRVMETLLWTAESMIDGARAEGRYGYIQAARKRLQPGLRFHLAHWLHRHFRIDTPLMHCMAERFEMLLLSHLVSASMSRFMRRRMEPVLGGRVTEVVGDIVGRREELISDAMETLRVQYPGYAEALETRILRQIGLRLEQEEYATLKRESLVGEELHDELQRGLDTLRQQVTRPLQFNIQSGLDKRINEFPIFAGLQDALLHDLAMNMTIRFAVPGEWIYRRRQRSRSVFFISRGEVTLQHERMELELSHGEFFGEGELSDPARPRRRQGRARATTFCHLLELDRKAYQRLLMEAPELARRIERVAATREAEARAQLDPAAGQESGLEGLKQAEAVG